MKKIFLVLILGVLTGNLIAQEPTMWRNGTDGIYSESGLLAQWPVDGPDIIWTFEGLGQGHSSPVISGNHLYTAGMLDDIGYLFKLTLEGELVYKNAYGAEYTESFYGSRGTPVVVGDKVYMVSGLGVLYCLSEKDGKEIWSVDMVNDMGGEIIKWGYNETPVVDGDIIYATPGGKENNFVALNRHTGKLIWSSKGTGELTAYCTPLMFTHNGRKLLATHTESHLMCIDPENGNMLWKYNHPNKWSVHANTPIYHDGDIFLFSGYGKGSAKLTLNEDGSSVKTAWSSVFDSRIGGAVLIDGYIYGSGDKERAWRCIDWETGKDMWTSEQVGKGVTIAADGKLFGYSDRGELVLVNATPEKFNLVSKTRVTKGSEQHWAHPIIHNGVLYLRHGNAMIAYKVK